MQPQGTTVDSSEAGSRILSPVAFKLALILLLSFGAYASTLGFQFVYDDQSQILENPYIQNWHYAPQLFFQQVWAQTGATPLANYYRPLFMLWLLINYLLFGLHPIGWHLTTVAIHLLATFMAFQTARRLVDIDSALLCALLFGIHPVHMESVAWISGVTDPLLAVFLLTAFIFYIDADHGHIATRLTSCLACYACALLVKEPAVIFPVMVLGYEFLFRSGRPRPAHNRLTLFLAGSLIITGLYLEVRTRVLSGIGHNLAPIPFSYIVFTWPSLFWFFTKHLLFPFGLSGFYGSPFVLAANWRQFWLPLLAEVSAAFALYRVWRRTGQPVVPFACLLFLLPLAPLLDLRLIPSGGQANHDRYLYLPSFGFCLLLAFLLTRAFAVAKQKISVLPGWWLSGTATAYAAVGMIAIAWTGAVVVQSQQWETSTILYSRALHTAPNDGQLRCLLGNELFKMGLIDEAIIQYRIALPSEPVLARYHLGLAYYQKQQYADSANLLEQVHRLSPEDPDTIFYLGLADLKLQKLDQAETSFRLAISESPDHPFYHYWLGMVLRDKGELHPAEGEFQRELAIHPQDSTARQQVAEVEEVIRAGQPHARN